jgi:hypothetical protein
MDPWEENVTGVDGTLAPPPHIAAGRNSEGEMRNDWRRRTNKKDVSPKIK